MKAGRALRPYKIQPPATEWPRRADVPPRTIFKSCGLNRVGRGIGQEKKRVLLIDLLLKLNKCYFSYL
jgi:hypothetical protein